MWSCGDDGDGESERSMVMAVMKRQMSMVIIALMSVDCRTGPSESMVRYNCA